MSIILSDSDVERLASAVELLVSPFAHATVDGWRSAVNTELKHLLGADSAGFMLPGVEGAFIYSDEHDRASLERYPGFMPPPLADGTPFWTSLLTLGSGHLEDFYRGEYRIYGDSEYYRDYAGANGAHDSIALGISTTGSVDVRDSASLQLWHSTPTGRRFSDKEKSLLKLLRPAFRAGVEAHLRFAGQHVRLIEMIDAMDQAVRVCDVRGRRLHRSRALEELLASDPESDGIVAAIDEAVRAAVEWLDPQTRGQGPASVPTLSFETRTRRAGYRIVVSLHRLPGGAPDTMLLASVARTTPLPMNEEELRRGFRLTRAQARVAALLAEGVSNAEIAERLVISPHTARKHTEQVLIKLGVHSRAEVATRILR